MGIFDKQYQKILSEEILKFLLEGKTPNSNQLAESLSAAFSKKGNTVYQFFPQPNKSVFNVEQYNNSLKQIKFDLDLFQEELLSLFSDSVKRINYANLNYNINDYQLSRLKAELESALFSISDADFYFAGSFDNFIDTTKTNLDETTLQAVNTKERVLEVPVSASGVKRILTPHLIDFSQWTIDSKVQDGVTVIRSSAVPGSKFGNMFKDTLSAWSYEIYTSSNGPVEISFRFPLAAAQLDEVEVFINKIQAISASAGPQTILIKTSTDNVNYFPLTGYENGVLMNNQSVPYSFNFETRLVQYVEITLTKKEADKIIQGSTTGVSTEVGKVLHQYIFGLSSFSAFTIGRQRTATYVSKPFIFNNEQNISKILIDSSFEQPAGTKIKYYIALSDKNGKTTTDFLSINPVGKVLSYSAPEILEYTNSVSQSKRFTIPAAASADNARNLIYGSPVRGKNIYKLIDSITPIPLYNSVELYRGYGSWTRDSSLQYNLINVENYYIDFTNTDIDNLCTLKKEVINNPTRALGPMYYQINNLSVINNPPSPPSMFLTAQISKIITYLVVENPVHYVEDRGHSLRPPIGVDGTSVANPNFAIYKVKVVNAGRKKITIFAERLYVPNPEDPVYITMTVSNFIISDAAKKPDIGYYMSVPNAQRIPLVEGSDYIIETQEIDGVMKPTGRLAIPPGSAIRIPTPPNPDYGITSGVTIEMFYYQEEDITHRVVGVQDSITDAAGNTRFIAPNRVIKLDYTNHSTADGADIYEVTYRSPLAAPDELVKSSVEVFSESPTPTSVPLREGVAYTCNGRAATIQILPNSPLRSTGAYVNFSFRKAEPDIETFTAWCKVDAPTGVDIRFDLDSVLKTNKLKIDTDAGEAFYVTGPFGLLDIGKAGGIPKLPRGWIQFIVISKNPSKNKQYGTNLIDQVIQLRDLDRRKIFKEGSIYFSSILAFRDSLVERTLSYLKNSTLASDYQSFAVDTSPSSGAVVLVNFPPNNSKDIYSYVPTADSTSDGPPQKQDETFFMKWNYVLPLSKISNSLVVRIDLERDVGVDDAISPKVFGYNIRVGF